MGPAMLRRWGWTAVLALALAPWGNAGARDLSALYDDATLQHGKDSYRRGLTRNFQEVIWPFLTPQEQTRLAGLRIDIPLRNAGSDPFTYFAGGNPPVITLSALSLKFFDDISVALAWLQRNGYSVETPFEYIEVGKYRTPQELGGRYPPPLEALRIPPDALQDPAVDRLAGMIFDSAIGFVLLHEMGHIVHGHPGYGPGVRREDARADEAEADRFALDVMRRTRSQPTGMAFLFIALAVGSDHRGDFASEADYVAALARATHPLTAERLEALARDLSDHADRFVVSDGQHTTSREPILYIAGQLQQVSSLVRDTELQRFSAAKARRTTLTMLAPRRPGQPAAPEPEAGVAQDFHGGFDGTISLPDGSLPIRTLLRRNGDRVSGEYYYGNGEGKLDGRIQGATLHFQWREGGLVGMGAFTLQENRSFSGSWGMGQSSSDGGTWTGVPLSR